MLFATASAPCDSCIDGFNMFAGSCISDSDHTAVIVSITVGVIVVVALFGVVIAFLLIRNRKKTLNVMSD